MSPRPGRHRVMLVVAASLLAVLVAAANPGASPAGPSAQTAQDAPWFVDLDYGGLGTVRLEGISTVPVDLLLVPFDDFPTDGIPDDVLFEEPGGIRLGAPGRCIVVSNAKVRCPFENLASSFIQLPNGDDDVRSEDGGFTGGSRPSRLVFDLGAGRDTFIGEGLDEIVDAGPGNDLLRTGEGRDRLLGGRGDDRLFGGPDVDFFRGGPGDDFARGGGGNDKGSGGPGKDDFKD